MLMSLIACMTPLGASGQELHVLQPCFNGGSAMPRVLQPVGSTSPPHNRLLAALAPEDLARLCPHLQPVALILGEVLGKPGRRITHALFPEAGMVSLIAVSPSGQQRIEVGVIGREGLVGSPVVLGTDVCLHETLAQADLHGVQVPADALRRAMADSPALHRVLLRYVQALSTQTAHTALANAAHRLDQRLARWLLMAHDRLGGDELLVTQPMLSRMLGANRPGVTEAVRALKDAGLIGHTRGRVTVLDRAGLEGAAGGSYGAPETEYARLFGLMR